MTESVSEIDLAITGGGILGLWSALLFLKKFPDKTVVVFEKENFLGEHTSGRNSEVLHSGIYYPTNSLKHLSCLRGNLLWRDYLKLKKLPFFDSGKIIAAKKNQLSELEQLYKKGVDNHVLGLRKLSKSEVASFSNIIDFEEGVFISSSAVLNVSENLRALRQDVEGLGGVVLTQNFVKIKAHTSENFDLLVGKDLIRAKNLLNVAGLFAIELREQLGLNGFENYYVKGCYLKLKKPLDVRTLIYPIPPKHGLGLGVHLTIDTAYDQKFGPDTTEVSEVNYDINETIFEKMIPSIQEIFKGVHARDLILGYSGIRPKVKQNGVLVTDFLFHTAKEHGKRGYFEFLGIESPGVTAAPALAEIFVQAFLS